LRENVADSVQYGALLTRLAPPLLLSLSGCSEIYLDLTFPGTVTGSGATGFLSSPVTHIEEEADYRYVVVVSSGVVQLDEAPTWLVLSEEDEGFTLAGLPDDAEVGDHDVSLSLQDTDLTQSFAVTVEAINDRPVILSIEDQTVDEDEAWQLTLASTDADDTEVTWTLDGPSWISLTSGVLDALPGQDEAGFHDLVVTAQDPGGAANTESFRLTVAEVDDPAVFTSTPVTEAAEDVEYRYDVTAADPDDVVDIVLSAGPGALEDVLDGSATLVWTPKQSDVGTHDVVLEVGGVEQAFDIEVAATNDAPTVSSTPITKGRRGIPYSYNLDVEDVDGDDLSYAFAGPSWLSLTDASNTAVTLQGMPDPGDYGITVKVKDGSTTTKHHWALAVDDNQLPVLVDEPAVMELTSGDSWLWVAEATDTDGDEVVITVTSAPDWIEVTDDGTDKVVLQGQPGEAHVGYDDLELAVSDGIDSFEFEGTLSVASANTAPAFDENPGAQAATETLPFSVVMTGTDPQEDELFFELSTSASWLTITSGTPGSVSVGGTPADADIGVHAVSVRVRDEWGLYGSDIAFTVTVEPFNETPTLLTDLDAFAFVEDVPVDETVQAADAENDPVLWSAEGLPTWLDLTDLSPLQDAQLTGTPTQDDVGTYNITLLIDDDQGNQLEVPWSFDVTAVNDAPVLSTLPDDPWHVPSGEASEWLFTATDDDDDPATLAFSASGLPTGATFTDHDDGTATLSMADTVAIYTYTLTITVEDPTGDIDQFAFDATVGNVVVLTDNDDFHNVTDEEDTWWIYGLAGDDILYGSSTHPTVFYGGLGADQLYSGVADDQFFVTEDNTDESGDYYYDGSTDDADTLRIHGNVDHRVAGIDGVEHIIADGETVLMASSSTLDLRDVQSHVGIDHFLLYTGNETFHGTSQDDVVVGGYGSDTLYGYDGDDTFRSRATDPCNSAHGDTVFGGEGWDVLEGDPSNDGSDEFLYACIQLSQIDALNSIEEIRGYPLDNTQLWGTSQDNVMDLSGITVTDIAFINPGDGNDTVTGTDGDDIIHHFGGTDMIYGMGGDDQWYIGTWGTFGQFYGGDGTDTLYTPSTTLYLFDLRPEHEVERLEMGSPGAISCSTGACYLDLTGMEVVNVEQVSLGNGDAVFKTDMPEVLGDPNLGLTIHGNEGVDIISVTGGPPHQIHPGTGADQITLGSGAETVWLAIWDEVNTITDFDDSADSLNFSEAFDWLETPSNDRAGMVTQLVNSEGVDVTIDHEDADLTVRVLGVSSVSSIVVE
jgi:hypothetical protein